MRRVKSSMDLRNEEHNQSPLFGACFEQFYLIHKFSMLPLLVQQLKIVDDCHSAGRSGLQTAYDVRCAYIIRIVEVEPICIAIRIFTDGGEVLYDISFTTLQTKENAPLTRFHSLDRKFQAQQRFPLAGASANENKITTLQFSLEVLAGSTVRCASRQQAPGIEPLLASDTIQCFVVRNPLSSGEDAGLPLQAIDGPRQYHAKPPIRASVATPPYAISSND
jgi:hypothetical protein